MGCPSMSSLTRVGSSRKCNSGSCVTVTQLNTFGPVHIGRPPDWDLRIPAVMAAYKVSQHKATRYSSNFLMFGRELRAPVDVVFGIPLKIILFSLRSVCRRNLRKSVPGLRPVREQLKRSAERN